MDQRTYNVPSASEVAVVWIEGSELLGQFYNSVILYGKDRSRHGIRSYHGCYDALSYQKIEADTAFAEIMDVTMLFHTLYSSLRVSLGGTWIFRRKELVWKKSSSTMPFRRLIVGQKKKQVCYLLI